MPGNNKSIYNNFSVNKNNSNVNNSIYMNNVNSPNSRTNNEIGNNPVTPNGNNYQNANNARNNSSLTNENINDNASADEIDTAFSNIEDGAKSTITALKNGDKKNALIHFKNFKKSVKDYVYMTKGMNTNRVKGEIKIIKDLHTVIAKGVLDYESRMSNKINPEFMKVVTDLENYTPRNRNNTYNRKSRKSRKNRKNLKTRKSRK